MRNLRELVQKIESLDARYDVAFVVKYQWTDPQPLNPRLADYGVVVNETFLRVIASAGGGWDHVSVSLENRCPTWNEMEYIAKLFFKEDEVAMQLHLPAKKHINNHPFCLHWWRPHSNLRKIPMPPAQMV